MLMARASASGMEVLREDQAYFQLCARYVPDHAHGWLIDNYVSNWCAAMVGKNGPLHAQEAGRRTANQWLMGIMKIKGFPLPSGQEIKSVKF